MNVSKLIVEYLRDYGVKHVFGIIGSAMYRVFQALGETEGIDYICPLHEQSVSMGADGYSRSGDTLGVAVATCGPGTTNLMTGCGGAYTDSVPILYLVGYPDTKGTKRNMPIRHLAYQEFDIVEIFRPITKYVKLVERPENILYELQKAIVLATTGRKGPVMLVLPEEVMFADVNINNLIDYKENEPVFHGTDNLAEAVDYSFHLIKNAKKPVLLYGGGVRGAGAVEEARLLSECIDCPTATTYPMRDMMDFCDPLNTTGVGIFGTRAGNFAIYTADVLLCIGTRLEAYLTGNVRTFAPHAKLVVVDIDQGELDKLPQIGLRTDRRYCLDAKNFINGLLTKFKETKEEIPKYGKWIRRINHWKDKYPIIEPSYFREKETNPYVFLKLLSDQLDNTDRIVVGSGMACAWVGQAFDFKRGQRWIMQFSIGAMGYGLPAAIGASFATDDRVVCITGDGSLQMSINELATVVYYNKNIKIFVICNGAYGLIQKTQDDWNCGHYATDREHHLPLPDSSAVAKAYGLPVYEIYENADAQRIIGEVLAVEGPVFCAVHVPIENKIPVRSKGGRLDNLFPFLPEEEVKRELED